MGLFDRLYNYFCRDPVDCIIAVVITVIAIIFSAISGTFFKKSSPGDKSTAPPQKPDSNNHKS